MKRAYFDIGHSRLSQRSHLTPLAGRLGIDIDVSITGRKCGFDLFVSNEKVAETLTMKEAYCWLRGYKAAKEQP